MPKILCSPSLKFNLQNSAQREAGSFVYIIIIMLMGDSNTAVFLNSLFICLTTLYTSFLPRKQSASAHEHTSYKRNEKDIQVLCNIQFQWVEFT